MTEAVVRLWLKVNDPTALTAHETLQRALGYGRTVAGVEPLRGVGLPLAGYGRGRARS